MDKAALRAQMRAKKRLMTPDEIEEKSRSLAAQLFACECYRRAETIYGYLSYNQEVRTVPILAQAILDGKQVALPKVCGHNMRFYRMTDLSRVQKGYGGIPEPCGDEPIASDPAALVLMPGLAFDSFGHRVGYGGGFYDRFLAAEPMHPTVALCYAFQLLPTLETEEFDIPVDFVLYA